MHKYTKEQLDFILTGREEGHSWRVIESAFNEAYATDLSHDTLRMAIKNNRGEALNTKKKPTIIVPKTSRKTTDRTQYDRVLVISDTHVPYHHKDIYTFLSALKDHIDPDKVVHIGDEVDKHNMSFHDSDPDLMSAGDELKAAIKGLQPLYEMFPEVDLVDSNHGSMIYRKGKHHGIPRKYLKDYGDVLDAPQDWTWHQELNLNCGGNKVRFRHQFKKNILQAAREEGVCVVQGHFHSDFTIAYFGNSDRLSWGMTIGCLIDDDSLAFAYNKTTIARPIIGCGAIINGQPRLFPMVLNNKGRWIKKIV